jgi:Fic family protein
MQLEIIRSELLSSYQSAIEEDLLPRVNQLEDSELSIATFSFYTSVSAVFSSKIEGENIELDSYIKHKRFGIKYLPNYTKKIDDLYEAYIFAQKNTLTKENIAKAHRLLSKNLLPKTQHGKFRSANMYVTTSDGKIEYVAASPFEVPKEMEKFYADLETLLAADLSTSEVFFYASWIHLIFVKIHPMNDGNGRTGRLLEKWFLAEKLGKNAWFIESEKNYYQQHQTYYTYLRALGLEYTFLDYSKALPFLLLLPQSLLKIN